MPKILNRRSNWINQHLNDHYVKLAQKNKYRSRAAFKLIEILNLENFITPGCLVVDLGSAPGGWSQVIHERIIKGAHGFSKKSKLIALDLIPMKPISGVEFVQGNFQDVAVLQRLEEILESQLIDVVVSDLAPSLSGIKDTDSERVKNLCESVLYFSASRLQSSGSFLMKTFHNKNFQEIVEMTKKIFKKVVEFKPKASRKESSEVFLFGCCLK